MPGLAAQPKRPPEVNEESAPVKKTSIFLTTEMELRGLLLIAVKNMFGDLVDIHDITYKDTESYFNILPTEGSPLEMDLPSELSGNAKTLIIPDENKKGDQVCFDDIYDIPNYKAELTEVLNRYLQCCRKTAAPTGGAVRKHHVSKLDT